MTVFTNVLFKLLFDVHSCVKILPFVCPLVDSCTYSQVNNVQSVCICLFVFVCFSMFLYFHALIEFKMNRYSLPFFLFQSRCQMFA